MSRVYGNFSDFAAFGSWWTDLKTVAAEVIPAKTVVGKYLRGDTAGAVSAGTKYATGLVSGPGGVATPTGQVPSPTIGGDMPEWFMPVAIGGGALLLFLMLRKKGRR